MNYAVNHKGNLRGLVIMNTWAWPSTEKQKIFSQVMGGWPIGYLLQTQLNFFATTMIKEGIYHQENVTETLKAAYADPFPTPESRLPTWIFPQQIVKSEGWLAQIESKLPELSELPVQLVWGTKDPLTGGEEFISKWSTFFKNPEIERLDDASHFLQEDRPDRVAENIRRVFERTLK